MTATFYIGDVFDRMAELDCGHRDDDPDAWHTDGDDTVCSRCCPTCNAVATSIGAFGR
jgi:hypothetical protein